MAIIRVDGRQLRVSTQQNVLTASFDKVKQRCFTSKEKFTMRDNKHSEQVNKMLDEIVSTVSRIYNSGIPDSDLLATIRSAISDITEIRKDEKHTLKMSPIEFFTYYIEQKRIDSHTGRYISERTKVHHRTVVKRLSSFLKDKKLPDTFETFTSKGFAQKFTDWCYSTKNYKENTVYATFGVLKPFLNAAKAEGFEFGDSYKSLKGKCTNTDAIYLTEEEIRKIYQLDITSLIDAGEIDSKSTMEKTRDLFIIACWTGLRRSDINRLEKAKFDTETKTITITTEKTKQKIVIPMHPMVLAIYKKYKGQFPKLCDKGKTNNHLRECARLAGINNEFRMVENRGGKVSTLAYKKYQLVGMHTARRSFATNMFKRRFPTIAIMKLTGHTTESNFLKYIKVSAEENALMMAEEFYKAQKPFENDMV
ncbi:tyrosine-type recombinase/integrase [Sodaliphilus pleomorphus]|nr:tyrosine-type recombinase/integrase [Sodaliphilus pleomorphus]